MSYKYRVVAIQLIDVYASSEEEACDSARHYYSDELGGEDWNRLDTILLPYDFENGLTDDDLKYIGTHVDDDGVTPFAPVNDPF